MLGFDKNFMCTDLPGEIKKETKYVSKFFIVFMLGYFGIYTGMVIGVSFISRLSFSPKVSNIIINLVSELMVPLLYLFMVNFTTSLKSPKHPAMDKMTVNKFIQLISVSVFVMLAGAYTSSVFANLIEGIFGRLPGNIIDNVMSGMNNWEVILYAVMFAPVFEELLFRKLVIDKFAKYGTVFSVGISAFVFALVHANLYQFFYALGVGILLGYVYCVYGNIIYSMLIHSVLNAMGVIIPVLASIGSKYSSHIVLGIISAEILMFFFGGILFISRYMKKEMRITVEGLLIKPGRMLLKSAGFWMLVFVFTAKLVYRSIVL